MRITGGPSRGRKISGPGGRENRDLRPPLVRIRQSLFSQLQGELPGNRVLDLFAGTGAFGLEALSQGARSVVFVERDPGTARILERNVRDLGFRHQSRILVADALSAATLDGLPAEGTFGIVFIDPPFRIFDDLDSSRDFSHKFTDLLASDLIEDDALVILRLPRRALENLDMTPTKSRVYGRSAVAFFSRNSGE